MSEQGKYAFQFFGKCLGDLVPEGSMLCVDPVRDIHPMDIVAIVLAQGAGGPFADFINTIGDGGFTGVCKLFLGSHEAPSGETVYLAAQLNPPLISPIPASAIEALHCVVDGDESERIAGGISAEDQAALDLIIPFAGAGCSPVNPLWFPGGIG